MTVEKEKAFGKASSFRVISNLLTAEDEVGADGFSSLQAGVVAIGNFDGVHRGHRVVLDTARRLAEQNGGPMPAVAMTFEPHPRTVFNPAAPVFRLTPPGVKARLFDALDLDGMAIVPFDRDFSQMRAESFVTELLVARLKVAHVVVGYDFHFGKGREGSSEFLIGMGKRHGFGVSVVPAQKNANGDLVFSSSATRDCLREGDAAGAAAILGYRYFVTGTVIHGEKRGRDLGYPTANMALAPDNGLCHGIYAVRARVDGAVIPGVASYGRRPTFDNGAPLLETFLFDFSGDLYGKAIEIVFVKYLRGEAKFDSLEALIVQMDADSREARLVLEQAGEGTKLDAALDARAI